MPRRSRPRALPEEIRLSLLDVRDAERLSIPSQRTWPIGLLFGVFFAIFATVAGVQVRGLGGMEIESVFELMFFLFGAFWVLGWSVGVVVLFLITVLFLFYGESARIRDDRLVHVACLGPLKFLTVYDLAKVENVRVESSKAVARGRVRFDYGGGEKGMENDIPIDIAEDRARAIREAADSTRSLAAIGGVAARPAARDLPGLNLSQWLPAPKRALGDDHAEPALRGPAGDGSDPERARPLSWTSRSGLALLAANLVPLVGVLLLGWDLGEVMALFWAENAVIGLYGLLKLAMVTKWGFLFAGPFFLGHFGGFMAGHFLFVYYMFVRGMSSSIEEAPVLDSLGDLFLPLWPALVALLVSHGVSFVENFLKRREYVGRSGKDQMAEPYKRVIVLHLTIIFGGWLILLLGSPIPALIVLILLKTGVDLAAHRKEHAEPSPVRDVEIATSRARAEGTRRTRR